MRSEWRQWNPAVRRSWRVGTATAHVIYPMTGERVQQDDGTLTPMEFTYVEIPDDPDSSYYVVECSHRRDDLVPMIIAVHVVQGSERGRDVSSADLRRLDLELAIRNAWKTASHQPERSIEGGLEDLARQAPSEITLTRSISGLRKKARERVTPERLAAIADVYRTARPKGAPTKAVSEHFNFPTSTASLYVRRARQAGLDMGDGD